MSLVLGIAGAGKLGWDCWRIGSAHGARSC